MLMLCLAIRPPGTPVLDMFKYSRNQTVKFLCLEPGHISLSPKPGLLPLRKPARCANRIADRVLQGRIPAQVTDELTISDGLERGQLRVQPLCEQPGHLLHPAFLHHASHAARDLIV